MKKFFRMVMAFSLIGGMLAFSGCTDYEDDINKLDDRLTALENTVKDLQSKIDGGAVITGVTSTEEGVTVTLSDGSSFNLTNGANGSVVTIGEDGYWYIDGVKTDYPATGNGADADLVYYEPNMETGNWDKVTVDAETGEKTVEATEDSWRAEGVTAVWDSENGTLTFSNVEGSKEPIVITFGNVLRSIEFVPEYDDGKATATVYYIRTDEEVDPDTYTDICIEHNKKFYSAIYLGDNENPAYSVTGTFKVTPASYVNKLVENPELVSMGVLPVKTRGAMPEVYRTPVSVAKGQGEGYIDVTAIIPVEAFSVYYQYGYKWAQIALYVEDENTVDGPVAEEDETTEVNYVSSPYVGVKTNVVDIRDSYCFYNGINTKNTKDQHNAPWSDSPAEYTFYEGYEFGLAIDGVFYTLPQAAELIGVDVDMITPEFNGKVANSSIDASGVPSDKTKETDIKKLLTYTEDGLSSSIKMAKDAATMQWYVGTYMTVHNSFTLVFDNGYGNADTKLEVYSDDVTYTVANTSYTLKLAAKVQPWSYKFAKEHSSTTTATNLYDKPISFSEVEIVEFPTAIDAEDIKTIIGTSGLIVHPKKQNVTASIGNLVIPEIYYPYYGITVPTLKLTNIATEVAQIASVEVTNYTFTNKGDVTYTFECEYPIDELDDEAVDATFTVEFQLTLGALPGPQTIALDPVEVPYSENWTRFDVAVNDAHAKAYEAMSEYFEDEDAFRVAFDVDDQKAVDSQSRKAERNGDAIDVKDTRLEIRLMEPNKDNKNVYDEKSVISFFDGAMAEVGDKFTYRTVVESWYGVTYTFAAEAEVVTPGYSLEYAANNVTDGKVVVKGKLINGVFELDKADLANYFTVKNFDSKANLDVKFEVLTKPGQNDTWEAAKLNANTVDVEANDAVKNVGYLKTGSATVVWPSQKAKRAVVVKASLLMGTKVLDTKELTVEAIDPITYEESVEMTVTRTPGETGGMTAKLWTALQVYGEGGYTYSFTGRDTDYEIDVTKGDKINLVNKKAQYTTAFVRQQVRGKELTGYDEDGNPIYNDVTPTSGLDAKKAYVIDYSSDKLGFGAEIVKTEVNGAESTITTFNYDPASGTLTYEGDNASLQGKTVSVYVTFSFKHYLSENAAKTVTVKVNFKEAE